MSWLKYDSLIVPELWSQEIAEAQHLFIALSSSSMKPQRKDFSWCLEPEVASSRAKVPKPVRNLVFWPIGGPNMQSDPVERSWVAESLLDRETGPGVDQAMEEEEKGCRKDIIPAPVIYNRQHAAQVEAKKAAEMRLFENSNLEDTSVSTGSTS
ncbi:hypothetical protein B0H19DRAFT_1082028 [Mycena capillaripes]|nr:hypothetical protein B0H19DRAFT_1082028 [Mycena capillaripes]